MSLFTRTILLMSIFLLAFALAQGVDVLVDSSPSGIDRFVAARNTNRAIAYQTVAVRGGRVAVSTPGTNVETNQDVPVEGNPGSSVKRSESKVAEAAFKAAMHRQALDAEASKYVVGYEEGGKQIPGIDALNESIAKDSKRSTDALLGLNRVGDDFRAFGLTLKAHRNTINSSMQAVFNLDYQFHRALVDTNALKAERLQLEADEGRVRADIRGLEDRNYNLNRAFERTIKTLGMYEKYDPTLSAAAANTGKPWLRGEVVRVASDRMSGLVWVNIGAEDGAITGQRLAIYREGRFVAYLRVQSTGPGESLARLEQEFLRGERIQENDQVRVAQNFGKNG